MSARTSRYVVDWGHLVFLACIAGAVLWYLLDATSVSMNIHNLLLVAPLCVVALGLCGVIALQCFRRSDLAEEQREEGLAMIGSGALRASDAKSLLPIGAVAVALGAYVCLLDVIGFDVATWLFVMAVMLICGERRPLRLIIYPIVVAVVLISAFRALLPYPMYTVIL